MFNRILVIGATGLLGRPVVERLTKDGHTVGILTRSAEKAQTMFGGTVEIAERIDDQHRRRPFGNGGVRRGAHQPLAGNGVHRNEPRHRGGTRSARTHRLRHRDDAQRRESLVRR